MLIDTNTLGKTHSDVWGVLAAINDLYDRKSELFGSAEVRIELEQDLAKYRASNPEALSVLT